MSNQRQGYSAARLALGTFKLHGNKNVTRLTIPKALDHYPFPNETGEFVAIELIEPEDEEPYLKVQPTVED